VRGGGEERRAHEKRVMWLKLGLDVLMQADPRGEVTCSSAHTGNGLTDQERVTTQKTWLRGMLLLVSKASACPGLTVG